MIRLSTALFKVLLKKISEEQAFLETIGAFSLYGTACPRCNATGKLSDYGEYTRGHVSLENGVIADIRINPARVKCASCNTTHALLPDTLTPYSSYTLIFKITAIIAYYERDTTVVDLCASLNIAVSTLYEWRKLLAVHKDFMLGVLISRKTPVLAFLSGLLGSVDISGIIRSFFNKHGFSFMQRNASVSAAYCIPP